MVPRFTYILTMAALYLLAAIGLYKIDRFFAFVFFACLIFLHIALTVYFLSKIKK